MAVENGYQGTQGVNDDTSPFNAHAFLIRQILSQVSTATLVQIKAVTNPGAVSAVGFCDVLPLVNQLDGAKNAIPHGVIHNVPYFRIQGGSNAIILDPEVGDIGIALFADRDISSVKANKGAANPGSARRFDMADAVYIGGVLNQAPTQYIRFSDTDGIQLVSPIKIGFKAPVVETDAPDIVLNGALDQGNGSNAGNATLGGNLGVKGDVTDANGSINLTTHKHGGVQAGSDESGGPV